MAKSLGQIVGLGINIGAGLLLAGALIKHTLDLNHNSKPGIVYYVHGKEALDKRFETNEQLEKYLASDEGKSNAVYFQNLNRQR